MGRYYNGDINGKFWFGLQSSDAADRFGVIGEASSELVYCFDQDNLEDVEQEIKNIENNLGNNLQKIENFINTNSGYNDKILEENEITEKELSECVDLLLGRQIRDCIKENQSCYFTTYI